MGWQPLPSICSADGPAGRAQAVQGCLQGHSTKPEHSNRQLVPGQKALPHAHGEVGIHTRTTTTTSMPGRAHPPMENLRVEAQAQGSHNQLLECQPYSCTSPLSHTALPHPSATSTGAGGTGQPCPGEGDAGWLQDPGDSPLLTHQKHSQALPIR